MLGSFTFVLHTHLPYVLHHGKWPFGSDWLSEAVAECYIPLLGVLDRLEEKNIRAHISIDFSPILLEQLADPGFPDIFIDYCNERIELAEADAELFRSEQKDELLQLAQYWIGFYEDTLRAFRNWYNCDLIAELRKHSNRGTLDAMTCAATHGYLPLLLDDTNVRGQLRVAIATHEKHFGKKPLGIWLPECAYRPRYDWHPPVGDESIRALHSERAGIEEILAELGLRYFIVEGSLTKGGIPMDTYPEFSTTIHEKFSHDPEYARYFHRQPLHSERSLAEAYQVRSTNRKISGTLPVVFSRDRRTSEQVWSGEIGYPGDPQYLEFHKKHHNSGLRYWRVTDSKIDLGDKKVYDPDAAESRIESHADHFVSLIRRTLSEHTQEFGTEGVVCSPFDTELFGHWWFEGPRFIESVLTKIAEQPEIRLTDCAEYITERKRPYQTIALPEGSWGEGGGHYVWLNSEVSWMWEMLYPLERKFVEVIRQTTDTKEVGNLLKPLLEQASRELLLAESSDWQFLVTTASAARYATKRFQKHCKRLKKLLSKIEKIVRTNKISKKDLRYLRKVRQNDRPFLQIDLNAWR